MGPSDERELRRVSSESGVVRVIRDDEAGSPDDSTDFYPMTTSMTRELRLELESLDRQVFGSSHSGDRQFEDISFMKKELNLDITESENEIEDELRKFSLAADVFVWENPLHAMQARKNSTCTPDEQGELEYDGEILEDQNGVKSVTPIRLLKQATR